MAHSKLIRIADAPLLDRYGRTIRSDAWRLRDRRRIEALKSIFCIILLAWTLVNFTLFLYLPSVPMLTSLLVYFRYLLWPLIIISLLLHFHSYGSRQLLKVLWPFFPFLTIGVISGVVGFAPMESGRDLIFWTMGVLAAAVIGTELRPKTTQRLLFAYFMIVIACSSIAAIAVPQVGVSVDLRVEAGDAWNGLFPNKNQLGLICAYGILLALFVPLPRWIRVLAIVLSGLCLSRTGSQGSVIALVVALSFAGAVLALRRAGLSRGLSVLVLAATMITAIVVLIVGVENLLGTLGRDATLTGRTDIWPTFLERATQYWVLGAGPGSFTHASPVTADLTERLRHLGSIVTPHNMFIAAFGETGLFGLFAFVLPLLYFTFVLPFAPSTRLTLNTATFACTMIVGGLIETREVFGLGMNMFILVLLLAAARRDAGQMQEGEPEVCDHDASPRAAGFSIAVGLQGRNASVG